MNDETQMLLFQDAPERITNALSTLRENAVLLPNHVDFVQQLGTHLLSLPPGSVILAAAPGATAFDELCSWLRDHLDQAQARGVGKGSAALSIMNVPQTSKSDEQRRLLLDSFYDGPRFSPASRRAGAEFELEPMLPFETPNRFRVVTSLVSYRAHTDYYLLRNGNYLQRHSASDLEGVEQVQYLIQFAEASKRTVVVLANPAIVCRWLKMSEIAEAVSACVLKPYNLHDEVEGKIFRGVLAAYDKDIIPWEEPQTLTKHATHIANVVGGCPYRLRKWVEKALIAACSRGLEILSWKFFCEFGLLTSERGAAHDDFVAIHNLREPPQNRDKLFSDYLVPRKKGRSKPGRRNLGRDDVGYSAA